MGQKHSKRQRARRYISQLMDRFGGRCAYCHELVIPVNFVSPVRLSSHWVWFYRGDELVHCRRATVDHVQPLSTGGANNFDNLALSCEACNHNKDKTPRAAHNLKCRRCGTTAKVRYKRYCNECGRLIIEEFQMMFLGRS